MQHLSFSELCEIIKSKLEEENEEILYRAYSATVYNALTGISFLEFKANAENNKPPLNFAINTQTSAEEIKNKVEHYIDDYEWEEV